VAGRGPRRVFSVSRSCRLHGSPKRSEDSGIAQERIRNKINRTDWAGILDGEETFVSALSRQQPSFSSAGKKCDFKETDSWYRRSARTPKRRSPLPAPR